MLLGLIGLNAPPPLNLYNAYGGRPPPPLLVYYLASSSRAGSGSWMNEAGETHSRCPAAWEENAKLFKIV